MAKLGLMHHVGNRLFRERERLIDWSNLRYADTCITWILSMLVIELYITFSLLFCGGKIHVSIMIIIIAEIWSTMHSLPWRLYSVCDCHCDATYWWCWLSYSSHRYVVTSTGNFMTWKSCSKLEVIAPKRTIYFSEILLIEDFTPLKLFYFFWL